MYVFVIDYDLFRFSDSSQANLFSLKLLLFVQRVLYRMYVVKFVLKTESKRK